MRTRLAPVLLLALVVPMLTGCRTYCGYKQWQCDNFGVCMFGTQPSYGRFAAPGPYPQPIYGQPTYGQPTYGPYGAPTQGPTYMQPMGATFGQPTDLNGGVPVIEPF